MNVVQEEKTHPLTFALAQEKLQASRETTIEDK